MNGTWAFETMDGKTPFLDGNIHAKVLSNRNFFADIYPMARKEDNGITFKIFIIELGAH